MSGGIERLAFPLPAAPLVVLHKRCGPLGEAVISGAAKARFQVVLGQHKLAPLLLQGAQKRLQAVAVFYLNHVPALIQQLRKLGLQRCRQAVDRGQQRPGREQAAEQGQRVFQWPAWNHDQAFKQRLQGRMRRVIGRRFRLRQQRDAMPALTQGAQQMVLPRLAAAGGRPRQVGHNPEDSHVQLSMPGATTPVSANLASPLGEYRCRRSGFAGRRSAGPAVLRV